MSKIIKPTELTEIDRLYMCRWQFPRSVREYIERLQQLEMLGVDISKLDQKAKAD